VHALNIFCNPIARRSIESRSLLHDALARRQPGLAITTGEADILRQAFQNGGGNSDPMLGMESAKGMLAEESVAQWQQTEQTGKSPEEAGLTA
jgi:hypothetical protein